MPTCGPRSQPSLYLIAGLACAMLFGCAQPERAPEPEPPRPAPTAPPPTAPPALPTPPSSGAATIDRQERGRISMYGKELAGRKTASGDPTALTMAHRTLPFGTRVRVTNLKNQRSVEVVVNDRGPFVAGRIADLSEAATRRIGTVADGVVEALLDILAPGRKAPGEDLDQARLRTENHRRFGWISRSRTPRPAG